MLRVLSHRRWSTLSLLGVSLGMSALAYFGGRESVVSSAMRSSVATLRVASPLPTTAFPSAGVASLAKSDLQSDHSAEDAAEDFERRWRRFAEEPRTPKSEREMADLLEALATRDPPQAMRLALGEGHVGLRDELRKAALRGWSAAWPDQAAAWALLLPESERPWSMEAVFAGAARNPDEAVRLGQSLSAKNPAQAGDYGQFLLTALTEAGAYERAARFATQNTTLNQSAWANGVFYQWASRQPDQAVRAFENLVDPTARAAAFEGLVVGWAMAKPETLVTYAMQLPPGENRAQALSQALPQWVGRDTLVASEWINQREPNPDFDAGVAAVATLPNLVNARPEIAVGWAESITEPVLRANTLRTVAQQWSQRDPAGMKRFLEATPELRRADRSSLAEGLQPPSDG